MSARIVDVLGGDDEELVQTVGRARVGDTDAWDQLFRRLYPRLSAYAARRVAAEAVDDVVNETMARAVASLPRYVDGRNSFDAWVFGIARRAVADHHRKLSRFRRTDGLRADVSQEAPSDRLEAAADRSAVAAAFVRLTASEREVLELRVVAGLTADETAAVLRKRPGAVRVAQHRALNHLRRLLGEQA